MASLHEKAQLLDQINTSPLLPRAVAAAATAALQVLSEDAATPEHDQRVRWAQSTLMDPQGMGRRMFVGVIANDTIAAAETTTPGSSSDNDIQFVVNSLITAFSRTV